MINTKIIAMYLPQFHCIPENDQFWGKGFTDWVTVKKANPLFKGHQQPRIPLNANYYDLSVEKNIEWQSNLAQEYGVYGFGIYHYWFNNEKNLLTRPAEIIRDSEKVNINYFFVWDNGSWVRSWSNVFGNSWAPIQEKSLNKDVEKPVLIPYIIGTEKDWLNHYNSVKVHFLSKKYIKKDNKPVFVIFNYDDVVNRMCVYWNTLAKKDGFDGIHFIFRKIDSIHKPREYFDFKYEPVYSGWREVSFYQRIINKCRKVFKISESVSKYDYDRIWKNLLSNAKKDSTSNLYHGAFVSYDDTPRRGNKGKLVKGASPKKFKHYLNSLVKISNQQGKDFIFLTAWNEWGEGAFLEPDAIYRYEYLEVIQSITKHHIKCEEI